MVCCWKFVFVFLVASVLESASSKLICGKGRNETQIVYSDFDFPFFFTAQVDGGNEWFCSENATSSEPNSDNWFLTTLICEMHANICYLKNYTGEITIGRDCKAGYRRSNPDGFCRIPNEILNCEHKMMELFGQWCRYPYATYFVPQNVKKPGSLDFIIRHIIWTGISTWDSLDNTISRSRLGDNHVRFNTYTVKGVEVRTANCVRLNQTNIPVVEHSWMHTVERELPWVNKTLLEIVKENYRGFFNALEKANILHLLNEPRVTVFVYQNYVSGLLRFKTRGWLQRRHILTDNVLCSAGFDDKSRTRELDYAWNGRDWINTVNFTRSDVMGINGVLHEMVATTRAFRRYEY